MKLFTVLALATLVGCAADEGASSQSLTQAPGDCGSLETHVFGIYAAPQGAASVNITRPGKHAIVLSAHDQTHWKVTAASGVTIEAIYAVGIHRQDVTAPAGVRVVSENQDDGGPFACGYAWGSNESGCDTEQLMNLVDKRVHQATSFHGCYEATTFKVATDLAVTADCNEAMSEQYDFVANCNGEDSCGGPIIL